MVHHRNTVMNDKEEENKHEMILSDEILEKMDNNSGLKEVVHEKQKKK